MQYGGVITTKFNDHLYFFPLLLFYLGLQLAYYTHNMAKLFKLYDKVKLQWSLSEGLSQELNCDHEQWKPGGRRSMVLIGGVGISAEVKLFNR